MSRPAPVGVVLAAWAVATAPSETEARRWVQVMREREATAEEVAAAWDARQESQEKLVTVIHSTPQEGTS